MFTCSRSRSHKRLAIPLVIIIVLSGVGGLNTVPLLHAQTQPAPKGVLILGEIDSIAVSDMSNPSSGGSISVAGKRVTIPDNLLIGLPGKRVTLRNLMLDAPDECKAQVPPQSGLAISDSCRNARAPGLARLIVSPNASGDLVAGIAMVQKDTGLTLGDPVRSLDPTTMQSDPADTAGDEATATVLRR